MQVHLIAFYLQPIKGFCCVWNETDCSLNGDVFLLFFIITILIGMETHPGIEKLIIWGEVVALKIVIALFMKALKMT